MTENKKKELAKRLYCYDYSGRFCKKCGFDSFENPWIMDYHHRDPSTKSFDVGHKIKHGAFEEIKTEIDKCDLVCSHCHRCIHYEKQITEYLDNIEDVLSRLTLINENGGRPKLLRTRISNKHSKERIEELVDAGMTIKDIANHLGETYIGVSAYLKKHDIKTLKYRKETISINDLIIKDYLNNGYSISSLGDTYEMSENDVMNILTNAEIPLKKKREKFTPEDIENVRSSLESNIKCSEIAKNMGCALASIYKLIRKHNLR